jgi:hypothetical protein
MKVKNLTRTPLPLNLPGGKSIIVMPKLTSRELSQQEISSKEVKKNLAAGRLLSVTS